MLGLQQIDLPPAAANQQRVAEIQTRGEKIALHGFSHALDGEHRQSVTFAEMRLFDGPADKLRAWGQQDFCQTEFLGNELSLLRLDTQTLQALHRTQQVAHLLLCRHQVKGVAGTVLGVDERRFDRCIALRWSTHGDNDDSKAALQQRLPESLTKQWRAGLDAQPEKLVVDGVSLDQIVDRQAVLGIRPWTAIFGKQKAPEHADENDRGDENEQTERREAEEVEGLQAFPGQLIADHQVGRRTDQGEHAAERASESHRHQQASCRHSGLFAQVQGDRDEDGYGAGVAHECR